jgi:hypothetical protein
VLTREEEALDVDHYEREDKLIVFKAKTPP